MIKVQDLNIKIHHHHILKDINVTLCHGKVTTVIGVNGSGKSTLLKAIAQTLKPTTGSFLLDGKDIKKMARKDIAKTMAVLPQIHQAPDDFTVEELISYGRHPHKQFGARLNIDDFEKINWAVKVTGLDDLKHRKVATLSGGERQRAWIAMCLVQEPKVLLLDEPTTFLDVAHQLELLSLIRVLNEEHGITIVMVLHDINQAMQYSDEVVIIDQGEIIQKGMASEVVTIEMMAEIFNINGKIIKDECLGYNIFIPISSRKKS